MSEIEKSIEKTFQAVSVAQHTLVHMLVRRRTSLTTIKLARTQLETAIKYITELEEKVKDE